MQNSYLKEMGIDVWVLRGSPQPVAAQVVTGEKSNELASGTSSATSFAKEEPGFHLCFLNYHSFGICLSLRDDEEVLSTASKRFCDDVALALNGGVRQPGINNLKWPVRGSEDNSHSAAQSIVSQRFMSLPGLVLVFGKETTNYVAGIESVNDDETINLEGRQILVVESMDEMCSGVTGKRKLWQRLQLAQGHFP